MCKSILCCGQRSIGKGSGALCLRAAVYFEIVDVRHHRNGEDDQREEAYKCKPIDHNVADAGADKIETESRIGPLLQLPGKPGDHQEDGTRYFEGDDHVSKVLRILEVDSASRGCGWREDQR